MKFIEIYPIYEAYKIQSLQEETMAVNSSGYDRVQRYLSYLDI